MKKCEALKHFLLNTFWIVIRENTSIWLFCESGLYFRWCCFIVTCSKIIMILWIQYWHQSVDLLQSILIQHVHLHLMWMMLEDFLHDWKSVIIILRNDLKKTDCLISQNVEKKSFFFISDFLNNNNMQCSDQLLKSSVLSVLRFIIIIVSVKQNLQIIFSSENLMINAEIDLLFKDSDVITKKASFDDSEFFL